MGTNGCQWSQSLPVPSTNLCSILFNVFPRDYQFVVLWPVLNCRDAQLLVEKLQQLRCEIGSLAH